LRWTINDALSLKWAEKKDTGGEGVCQNWLDQKLDQIINPSEEGVRSSCTRQKPDPISGAAFRTAQILKVDPSLSLGLGRDGGLSTGDLKKSSSNVYCTFFRLGGHSRGGIYYYLVDQYQERWLGTPAR